MRSHFIFSKRCFVKSRATKPCYWYHYTLCYIHVLLYFMASRGYLTPACWLQTSHKNVARLNSLSCYVENKWHFFKVMERRECLFYVLKAEYLQGNVDTEQNEIFCLLPTFRGFLET